MTGEIGSVRFYATHQLVTPEGVVIGTLCVFDEEPRALDDDQARALASLADRVVDLLELELRTRELSAPQEIGPSTPSWSAPTSSSPPSRARSATTCSTRSPRCRCRCG